MSVCGMDKPFAQLIDPFVIKAIIQQRIPLSVFVKRYAMESSRFHAC